MLPFNEYKIFITTDKDLPLVNDELVMISEGAIKHMKSITASFFAFDDEFRIVANLEIMGELVEWCEQHRHDEYMKSPSELIGRELSEWDMEFFQKLTALDEDVLEAYFDLAAKLECGLFIAHLALYLSKGDVERYKKIVNLSTAQEPPVVPAKRPKLVSESSDFTQGSGSPEDLKSSAGPESSDEIKMSEGSSPEEVKTSEGSESPEDTEGPSGA